MVLRRGSPDAYNSGMETPHSPASGHLILSPEQESIVQSSIGVLPVYKADGTLFGYLRPTANVQTPTEPLFTPEEIAAAEEAMLEPGPRYTTAQVLEHLRSLEGRV